MLTARTMSEAGESKTVRAPHPAFATLPRRVSLYAIVALTIGLAIWRLAYVLAGPDPDSDAYGHHAIARQILETPRDLSVHWVWLPLWHYTQALVVAIGGGMQTMRFVGVALSSLSPLMTYALLVRHRHPPRDAEGDPAPIIAAALTALSPIAMQMGTTAQTEPLFALLVLGVLWSVERGAVALASTLLSMAVLLRYEAWSIPPALLVVALARRVGPFRRFALRDEPSWKADVLPALVSGVAIFGWAALRHTQDPRWFAFLRETREFANGALGAKSSLDGGVRQLRIDLAYYAVDIPWHAIGYPLVIAPFGVWRTLKRDGLRFCVVGAALLSFLTITWVLRSTLGLLRHFVVLVPFYCALIGNGVVAIGDGLAWLFGRPLRRYRNAFLARASIRAAVISGGATALFALEWILLDRWMGDWRHASEEVWPERRDLAGVLRSLPGDALIFCDEPTVEMLSGLDRHRFERRSLDDPRAPGWLERARASGRPIYVATWLGKLPGLGIPRTAVIWRPAGWKDADGGLALARVR